MYAKVHPISRLIFFLGEYNFSHLEMLVLLNWIYDIKGEKKKYIAEFLIQNLKSYFHLFLIKKAFSSK